MDGGGQRSLEKSTADVFFSVSRFHSWSALAPVGLVWCCTELQTLLQSSLSLLDVACRLLLVCCCWLVLGGCVHVLRCHLRRTNVQETIPEEVEEDVEVESRNNLHACVQPSLRTGVSVVVTLALTDSLLICVLQEHLQTPDLAHIQALLSRLERVAHTLEVAGIRKGMTLDVEEESILTDKLSLLCSYLQQRTASLQTLVLVQAEFEAGVKALQQSLENIWTELEELHTGVTLFKEGSQGQVAVETAQTNAKTLFVALGRDRSRLETCRTDLKDSTTLLQELSWSHTHISNTVSSSSESGWPELLLQSNIEKFDKVQASFVSVEQQTSTFQAHLDGLGKAHPKEEDGVLPKTDASLSQNTQGDNTRPSHDTPLQRSASISSSSSSSSSRKTGKDPKRGSVRSLSERSALCFSSTISRLRISGRKK